MAERKAIVVNGQEAGGDVRGINSYFNLAAQGITLDKEVPKAFADMRALGTLRGTSNLINTEVPVLETHATNAAFDLAGDRAVPVKGAQSSDIMRAALNVNTYSQELLALQPGLASAKILAESNTRTQAMIGDIQKSGDLLKGIDGATIVPLAFGLGRLEFLNQMTATEGGKYAMFMMNTGAQIARDQPAAQYASVKCLLDSNTLADPTERRIAKDFVTAFERRAPEIANAPATKALLKSMDAGLLEKFSQDRPDMAGFVKAAVAMNNMAPAGGEPAFIPSPDVPPPDSFPGPTTPPPFRPR